jgi:zinc protease
MKTSDTAPRFHIYPNGLELIVKTDHAAPVVSLQAWCRTGSIHEGRWLGAGLSHILEHMLFKGTTTRGVSDIARTVQGAGGMMNAYTSFDRTVYYIDGPSATWRTCLDVLADTIFNASLPEEEYDREQDVIRREFAMGMDNPSTVASHLLFGTAYREHPYRHPVIGHLDIFNRLTRQDVLDYYRSRYVPNNITFVVTGDVAFEEIRDFLGAATQKISRAPLPDVFIPAEPPQLGPRDAHQEYATQLSHTHLAWHVPALTHPDVYALDILADILGGGRSSRLHVELVERQKLAHNISAFCYTPGQPGLFGVSIVSDPDKREAATEAALRIVAESRAQLFPATELDKSRRGTLASHLDNLQTMSGQAGDLGSSWFVAGDLHFSDHYLERIQAVTPEDVRRVAASYLTDSNRTTISLNPTGSLAPDPNAATAQKTASDVKVTTLSNGLRIVTRENPRLPLVSIRAVYGAGLTFETETNHGLSRLLASTLIKGTTTRKAEAIASEVEDLGGTIVADAGFNSLGVQLDLLSQDLPYGLALLSDILLHPTFPQEELDKERTRQLAALRAEKDQPGAICRDHLRARLFGPGHPYALNPLGSETSLAQVTRDTLKERHAALCQGKNLVVAVFGDVRHDDIVKAIQKELGSLPAGTPPLPPTPPRPDPAKEIRVTSHADKQQAVVQIGFPGISITDPDRVPLRLIEEALSDLASRLFDRIREKQGLAYYVGAQQRMGILPGHFVFYAGTDPAKVEHVIKEMNSEINQLATGGLDLEELQRAKAKLCSQTDMQLQSNGDFAQMAALDELFGLGANQFIEFKDQIQATTSAQINDVARRYFLRPGRVISIVQPPTTPKK